MALTKSMALQMLDLQAENQLVVNKEWITKGWPFLRAVVVEGAEGLDHLGYKWWKAQTPDLPQAQLELVDIWHFYLSELIVRHQGDHNKAATAMLADLAGQPSSVLFDGVTYHFSVLDFLRKMELIIGLATARRMDLPLFENTLVNAELDWDSLFKMYVGKNVLNQFRQKHGYKAGTYQKIWNGQEDNVFLANTLDRLGDQDELVKKLWVELEAAYPGDVPSK